MKKIIAIKSFVGYMSASVGQTYELSTFFADRLIADGLAIEFATALSNPKCPPIIKTEAIRIR